MAADISRNAPLFTSHHAHGMRAKIGGQLLSVAPKPTPSTRPRRAPSPAESAPTASTASASATEVIAKPTNHLASAGACDASPVISPSATPVYLETCLAQNAPSARGENQTRPIAKAARSEAPTPAQLMSSRNSRIMVAILHSSGCL